VPGEEDYVKKKTILRNKMADSIMETYTDYYSGSGNGQPTVLAERMPARDKVINWLDFDINKL
jgi:hypothetical protein